METNRTIASLRRDLLSEDGGYFPLVYQLLECTSPLGDLRYGVRCYVAGIDLEQTPDRLAEESLPRETLDEALELLERLAEAQVMPIHIADVLADESW